MNTTQPIEPTSKKFVSKLPVELIPSDDPYLSSIFPRIAILGEPRIKEIISMLKAGKSALHISRTIQLEWQANTNITPTALSVIVGQFRAAFVPMVDIDVDGMSKQERNRHEKRFHSLINKLETQSVIIDIGMAKINAVHEKELLEGKTYPSNTSRIDKMASTLKQYHDICIELFGRIDNSEGK